MKINKRQLKNIIKEMKTKILLEQSEVGLFSEDYIYDLIAEELDAYLESSDESDEFLSEKEIDLFKVAFNGALKRLIEDYGSPQ